MGRSIRRNLHRWRYNTFGLRQRFAGRWTNAVILLLIQVFLLWFVYYQTHADQNWSALALVAALFLVSNAASMVDAVQGLSRTVGKMKTWRKVKTAKIIDDLRDLLPMMRVDSPTVHQLQRDILSAVSSCVGNAFALDATEFVATLLIRSPANPTKMTRVIARSDDGRDVGMDYPNEGMIAASAMDQKQVLVTGEVRREYEGFGDRPYESVISLPVMHLGEAIAAVNVDHKRRFLFDGRELPFQTNLRPYLRLIVLTLTRMEAAAAVEHEEEASR